MNLGLAYMNLVIIAIVIGALIYNHARALHHCASKTYISNSRRGGMHGRGVFSNANIAPNQIIETGPLLVSADLKDEVCAMCSDYVWTYSAHASSEHELHKYAVALGSASICNHSNEPNANVHFQDTNYTLFAIRPIRRGDEILVSYCQGEKTCSWGVGRNITLVE